MVKWQPLELVVDPRPLNQNLPRKKRKVQQPMEKKEKENEIKLPTKTDSVNWPSENTKILCNLKKVLGL